jgi:hypothetical protein
MLVSSSLLIQPLLQISQTRRAFTFGSGITVITPSPRVKFSGPKSFRLCIHLGKTSSRLLTVFGQKMQMFGMVILIAQIMDVT